MKNSIIIQSLVLASLSLFSCNKVENNPIEEIKKLSTNDNDSVTATPNMENTNNDDIAKRIANYITNDYLSPEDLQAIEVSDRKFRYQQIDLNADGKKEVFVIFSTPYFCGTGGCSMILFDNDLKPITKFTVTRPPVYANPDTKNGWNVLYIKDREEWKQLIYENGTYPSNPTILPTTTAKPSNVATGIFEEGEFEDYPF